MPNNYILTSNGIFMSQDDYLQHWGLKKGEAAESHKYLKREYRNGRWVYWYDSANDSQYSPKVSEEALKQNTEQNIFSEKLNTDDDAIQPKHYDRYIKYQKQATKGFDYVKNVLGFDEYKMYKDTEGNVVRANSYVEARKKEVSEKKELHNMATKNSKNQRFIDETYTEWQDAERLLRTDKHYEERYRKAYDKAREDFVNTPIGQVYSVYEDIKERVDSWLSKIFKKKKR